jgi:hypothetical protein
MIHALLAAGAFATLFIGFGLLGRGRPRTPCDHCTCQDGHCHRAREAPHIELVE